MSTDDPFYAPGYIIPPRTKTRPPEPLWSGIVRDRRVYACELRYHGEWGVEAQILDNGELYCARRFDTRALAAQWLNSSGRRLKKASPDDSRERADRARRPGRLPASPDLAAAAVSVSAGLRGHSRRPGGNPSAGPRDDG